MSLERIPLAGLPTKGRGSFTVQITSDFLNTGQPWAITYKTSNWHSWWSLQTDILKNSNDKKVLKAKKAWDALSRKSAGVYEVARGWRVSGNSNLFLYIGSSTQLKSRMGWLVRGGPHTARKKILAFAKEAARPHKDMDDLEASRVLYIRWAECEPRWAPDLLEYYLHLHYKPCFPDGILFPDKRASDECAQW